MEINVNDENKLKIEQFEKDSKLNEYDKFYTKEQLKVSLINVDSAYRNFEPKNIYSTNVTYLPNNPLSFTQNSGLINVNYPKHNFNKGDNIIIQNVQPISFTVSGKMFLFQNNSYLFLQIPHTVTLQYLTLLNQLQIQIDVANGANVEGIYFYGNIPLNSILGVFNIIFHLYKFVLI
jgi:hypothetical protein